MHFLAERAGAPSERVERHRRGDVRGRDQFFQSIERQRGAREHLRGAVVERQTFLERQAYRREIGALERFGSGHAFAAIKRFTTTEQHDRQVRQRREIAARADRTLFRNHRNHVVVEQVDQRVQGRHADAGMPAHQRVDADHEHRAHDARIERLADADRVRDHEVVLQLFQQRAFALLRVATRQFVARAMRAEQLVGIAAETGSDAVDRFAAADFFGEEVRRALHMNQLRLVERDARAAAGDCDQLFAGQAVTVEKNRVHGSDCVGAAEAAMLLRSDNLLESRLPPLLQKRINS